MVQRFGIFVLAASLFVVAGCSSRHQPTDSEIIGNVITRLRANPQTANKIFSVSAQNGVVTVNGTAESDAERTQVAQIASQVEGVKTVINDVYLDAPQAIATTEPEPAPTPQQPEAQAKPKHESSKPSAYHEAKASAPTKPAAMSKTVSSNTVPANNSNLPVVIDNSSAQASSGPEPVRIPALPSIPSTPAVKPVQLVRIDSGTPLSVRLIDSIDSSRNQPGDSFRGTLDSPVYAGDQEAIPAGASVMGRVTEVQSSGRFSGRPQIALELTALSVNGRSYSIQTNQFTKQGNSQGSRTAKTVGGGAAIGALIGAIAGGGKGAAIGAAVGAGSGGGIQAARGAQNIRLGSETRLNFRLENSISVVPATNIERPSNNSDVYSNNSTPTYGPSSVQDDEPQPVDTPDGDRPVLKRRPKQQPPQ